MKDAAEEASMGVWTGTGDVLGRGLAQAQKQRPGFARRLGWTETETKAGGWA